MTSLKIIFSTIGILCVTYAMWQVSPTAAVLYATSIVALSAIEILDFRAHVQKVFAVSFDDIPTKGLKDN